MIEGVAVEIRCPECLQRQKIYIRRVLKPYYAYHKADRVFLLCQSYDRELRWIGEPLGWYKFAWWPVRCRNGFVRWLCWVEKHADGTYSLGNRAG